MANIGTEQREIHVEPLQIPIPQRETRETPTHAPAQPIVTPQREPVGVPR